ncbi:hypothetical protein KIN20_028141 [Parelaphostrongylus tenuis]|uniref:Uncharacterized protein n=1 Tax=Parelaphostrongylus tenuis TaxID=148309 RepID=A0AAD5WEK0_PARTN|nr:hypothetical protein KIN20_028141 [Parelaphostrongylus tenuis]
MSLCAQMWVIMILSWKRRSECYEDCKEDEAVNVDQFVRDAPYGQLFGDFVVLPSPEL